MEQSVYDRQFKTIVDAQEGMYISEHRMSIYRASVDARLRAAMDEKQRAEAMLKLHDTEDGIAFAQRNLDDAVFRLMEAIEYIIDEYNLNHDTAFLAVVLCEDDYTYLASQKVL